jgi:hypothetical protein
MKIYQIHEYSGEYECYRDYIVGSYLNEEKAIAKMEELQRIEVERRVKIDHCSLCPILDSDVIADTFDMIVKRCSMYCRDAKITEDRFGYDCENYCDYWDEATYEIKEVEVIE